MLRPTTVAYSISLKVRLQNLPGALGRLTSAVGEAGGNITAIEAGVVRLHRAV